MHPAQTPPGRGTRLPIILVAVALLAACTTGRPPDPAEPRAEPSAEPRTSPAATDPGASLCASVDVNVVQSVVGVRDVPDPAAKATDTGSGWNCSWKGDWRDTGPNGQVGQPSVDVTLYRDSLGISEGGEAPTTVAGRAGTIRQAPGRCTIKVQGTERTLVVDTATADSRRDSCPATMSIAEPLVKQFIE